MKLNYCDKRAVALGLLTVIYMVLTPLLVVTLIDSQSCSTSDIIRSRSIPPFLIVWILCLMPFLFIVSVIVAFPKPKEETKNE